jgi:hypothetical protein
MARASTGSLMSASTSLTWTRASSSSRSAPNSASSAAGSWNGCPSVAISETPRSGTNSVTGPRAALSFRAMRRPSSAHSDGVVRMSVTVGLCL